MKKMMKKYQSLYTYTYTLTHVYVYIVYEREGENERAILALFPCGFIASADHEIFKVYIALTFFLKISTSKIHRFLKKYKRK